MPDEACDLVYMCGHATKACMAQWSVVLLLLNKRLWVQLSVPHFLFLNKSKEPGSESTGIGLLSARNLLGPEQNPSAQRILAVRAEWVKIGRNGSEYGRNMVGIRVNMAGCPAKLNSYQIPTIPTRFLAFRSDPLGMCGGG